jgi:hypothetical protein
MDAWPNRLLKRSLEWTSCLVQVVLCVVYSMVPTSMLRYSTSQVVGEDGVIVTRYRFVDGITVEFRRAALPP